MAAWLAIIPSLLSLVGDGVKGFFGVKQSQIDTVNKVAEVINASEQSSSTREQAVAQVIAAEASSGYWLAACWRPLLMLGLMFLFGAYCLGWTTPNLLAEIPVNSILSQLFEIFKIGVVGYMPLRTIEKIVDKVAVGKLIEQFLSKK